MRRMRVSRKGRGRGKKGHKGYVKVAAKGPRKV